MSLAGLYRSHINVFRVKRSVSSSWKLIPFVVLYCCDKADCKHLFFMRHENTVDCLCTRCFLILQSFAVQHLRRFRIGQKR